MQYVDQNKANIMSMDSVAHAVINYLDAEHSVGNLASLSTLTVEVFRCQGDDRKFPGLRWNSPLVMGLQYLYPGLPQLPTCR